MKEFSCLSISPVCAQLNTSLHVQKTRHAERAHLDEFGTSTEQTRKKTLSVWSVQPSRPRRHPGAQKKNLEPAANKQIFKQQIISCE